MVRQKAGAAKLAEDLILKRSNIQKNLERIIEYAEAADEDHHIRIVKSELKNASRCMEQLETLHDQLLGVGDDDQREEMSGVEAEFFRLHGRVVKALREYLPDPADPSKISRKRRSSSPECGRDSVVKLPKLELPTFSGNLDDWTSFHDLFVASVDSNKMLSGGQKLQYLKSIVKGEARNLINSFTVSHVNYKEAWGILCERHDHKKIIIFSHINGLLHLQGLREESKQGLRKLLDSCMEKLRALQALGEDVDSWDSILVCLISEKLDPETRKQWELETPSRDIPTFGQLREFLNRRCMALEAIPSSSSGMKKQFINNRDQFVNNKDHGNSYHSSPEKCHCCTGKHPISICFKFKKMDVAARSDFIKKRNLCFKCLGSGHSSRMCQSDGCSRCSHHHHSLLHFEKKFGSSDLNMDTRVNAHVSSKKQVLLATALGTVNDVRGDKQICRILLDSGSQMSFVTESCAQRLGLPRIRSNLSVNGIGQTPATKCKGILKLNINSSHTDKKINVEAYVLTKLCNSLPSSSVDSSKWEHVRDLKLADPNFHTPGGIDIILGSDVFNDIVMDGEIRGQQWSPVARKSIFGWILSGPFLSTPSLELQSTYHGTGIDDTETLLQRFWELDEPRGSAMSIEEKKCEKHFENTHGRDDDGRYVVRIPFKEDSELLGNSYGISLVRLKSVKRRLAANPKWQVAYRDFMNEYMDLDHMEVIAEDEITSDPTQSCYLPHHFVLKESSTTTKLRVVFDASKGTGNGISLNQKMMIGPTIQDDLLSILRRFRTHKIAFTADVEKMYRQIRIHHQDHDFQRILWRTSPDLPVQHYRLKTVTYGTASAPYLATKCLQQLARDESTSLPIGAELTLKDFYVDDLMSGSSDLESALEAKNQVVELLARGGMNLRKWTSNSSELLESIAERDREVSLPLTLTPEQSVKALGIQRHPGSDQFSFTVTLPDEQKTITKRSILSDNARIFDPEGFLAPVTVNGKIFMQRLWTLKSGWDQDVPQELMEEWILFRRSLTQLKEITISRWISTSGPSGDYQLHGFCDASEKAYAATVYIRVRRGDQIDCHLIGSKTKVAPLKQVSLPRLELCGALLVSRLLQSMKESLQLDISETHAWTDSTVPLAWISGHPQRWRTFVTNRVSEIQDLIPPSKWHHVASEENPADCASRGVSPEELKKHPLWWSGPKWLKDASLSWNDSWIVDSSIMKMEERKVVNCFHLSHVEELLLTRFSFEKCLESLLP